MDEFLIEEVEVTSPKHPLPCSISPYDWF